MSRIWLPLDTLLDVIEERKRHRAEALFHETYVKPMDDLRWEIAKARSLRWDTEDELRLSAIEARAFRLLAALRRVHADLDEASSWTWAWDVPNPVKEERK